jgi:hypothetical protein
MLIGCSEASGADTPIPEGAGFAHPDECKVELPSEALGQFKERVKIGILVDPDGKAIGGKIIEDNGQRNVANKLLSEYMKCDYLPVIVEKKPVKSWAIFVHTAPPPRHNL